MIEGNFFLLTNNYGFQNSSVHYLHNFSILWFRFLSVVISKSKFCTCFDLPQKWSPPPPTPSNQANLPLCGLITRSNTIEETQMEIWSANSFSHVTTNKILLIVKCPKGWAPICIERQAMWSWRGLNFFAFFFLFFTAFC